MENMIDTCRRLITDNHSLFRRDFPWRHTKEPYNIMIAEFMLHRTKAEQVSKIYINFLHQYPDIYSLSNAEPSEIAKVTQHLGLHWRSNHFISSAKYIVENLNSIYPEDRIDLLMIPGIGDYVAGAILTVCFEKQEYVVDCNIARFINRYFALSLEGEIRRKKPIINIASQLFNTIHPGKLLFAILDFTALICKPKNSECKNCVLQVTCSSYLNC